MTNLEKEYLQVLLAQIKRMLKDLPKNKVFEITGLEYQKEILERKLKND